MKTLLFLFAFFNLVITTAGQNLEISNLNKHNYGVDSIKLGTKQYIDRKIVFRKLPSFLMKAKLIKTANDDKMSEGNDFLSFTVNKNVSVFIAYWDLLKNITSWMNNGFVKTDLLLTTSDGTYNLYKKDYPSGVVKLGGNLGSKDEEDIAMYSVLVTDQMSLPDKVTYIPSLEYHLSFLRRYPYQKMENKSIPEFIYQNQNDSSLLKLKQKFELDKIAGNGDDVVQIVNLMKWVNTRIKHNGSNSELKNSCSMSIIDYNDQTEKGVNCRMVATILNDVYLASGFKARIISCLPNEDYDTENHVTNLVFSKSLDKWIYMDPSFGSFVTDRNGILLNHAEIRQALISGDSLIVKGLIHNGKPYGGGQTSYLEYMSKNLFRFSSPLYSQYGYETNVPEPVYVNLNPQGYRNKEIMESPVKKNKKLTYYTSDQFFFWNKPQNNKSN